MTRWRARSWCPPRAALRRLVYQLDDIGLPIDPFWRRDGGLAFDLLSSYSDGRAGDHRPRERRHHHRPRRIARRLPRVAAGATRRAVPHACSATSATRSATTTRHVLVETGSGAAQIPRRLPRRCSATNGPATATRSRGTTSSAHPTAGRSRSSRSTPPCIRGRTSPSASRTTCTSPTPSTPAARRAWCCRPTGFGSRRRADIVPLESYDDVPIERLLFDWRWMSLFFNRVNTAMGKNPLYPFEIPDRRWSPSSGSFTG